MPTNLNEIFKCNECGNLVEVVGAAGGTLVCCNQPMKLLKENTTEASKEKHIPVIEQTPAGILVKVGSVAHPMEEKHYITWIELLADGKVYRQTLKPGQKPEALFDVKISGTVSAREFCNLHGLWKA